MLAPPDEADPRLGMPPYRVTVCVRMVPLLSGGWCYATECSCGNSTHGAAATGRSVAEVVASRSLPCWGHAHQVVYQDVRNPANASRLALTISNTLAVKHPHGQVALAGTWRPGDVAVDASFRAESGMIGVAAVTGGGWLQIRRLPEAQDYTSQDAEFIALVTGLEMMPPSNNGTLYSDNKRLVAAINYMADHSFRKRFRPPWLSRSVYQQLMSLFIARRMTVTWRRRNSTELMVLAHKFARLTSAPTYNDAAITARLTWERTAGHPGEHAELIQRTELLTCHTEPPLSASRVGVKQPAPVWAYTATSDEWRTRAIFHHDAAGRYHSRPSHGREFGSPRGV